MHLEICPTRAGESMSHWGASWMKKLLQYSQSRGATASPATPSSSRPIQAGNTLKAICLLKSLNAPRAAWRCKAAAEKDVDATAFST